MCAVLLMKAFLPPAARLQLPTALSGREASSARAQPKRWLTILKSPVKDRAVLLLWDFGKMVLQVSI